MKYDVRHSNFTQATGLTHREPDNVGADLCVCPGFSLRQITGADTQVCPYAGTVPIQSLARLLWLTMLCLFWASPGFAQQRGGRQPQLQPPATGGSPQVAGSNSFEGTLADTNKDYL